MSSSYSNGSGPETRLIRGEVVVEQEFDADGRPGRWRRMAITVPLIVAAGVGITSSVTLSIDLPDGRAADVAEPDTWANVVQQMGGANTGGNHEG